MLAKKPWDWVPLYCAHLEPLGICDADAMRAAHQMEQEGASKVIKCMKRLFAPIESISIIGRILIMETNLFDLYHGFPTYWCPSTPPKKKRGGQPHAEISPAGQCRSWQMVWAGPSGSLKDLEWVSGNTSAGVTVSLVLLFCNCVAMGMTMPRLRGLFPRLRSKTHIRYLILDPFSPIFVTPEGFFFWWVSCEGRAATCDITYSGDSGRAH